MFGQIAGNKMGLFKKDEEYIEEVEELNFPKRKFKDLKPEHAKKRKEPVKPWGKFERLFILVILILTVATSGFLALSARNYKLPKLPILKLPNLSELNPFKEQVIVIGNKGSQVSQKKIDNTKRLFKEATNSYSGIYAFYIYDLKGDYYYGLNYQQKMQAASLIKLPVMYLAMKNNEDKSLVEAMGKRSDNFAFNTIVESLGKEVVNNTIYDLGMPNTSLSENTTTPEEVGLFFKKLYKKELLDNDNSQELINYMTDTIFEDWLRAGIPSEYKLAHKYGREARSVSDAGIVFSEKPFVLVVMTDGVIEREADELFPKLTKLLYTEHTNEDTN